jgi:hypothetical protein
MISCRNLRYTYGGMYYDFFRASSSAIIVLLFSRWLHLNPTTVGFSLLLAVLLISTTWGLRYATFTAILGTTSLKWAGQRSKSSCSFWKK